MPAALGGNDEDRRSSVPLFPSILSRRRDLVIPAVLPTYARNELTFQRGEGAYLYATDGRKYLDFASGVAVTALGHGHPRLVAALTEQAQLLWHCSNLFQIAPQKRLAE